MGPFSFAGLACWPFRRNDTILIASITLGAVALGAAIGMFLDQYQHEVRSRPPRRRNPPRSEQEQEDMLRVSTLEVLVKHHNFAISQTAMKIVRERAAKDQESIRYLLWGITQPDYEGRYKCLEVLDYIIGLDPPSTLCTKEAHAALVRNLEMGVQPNQEKLNDIYYNEFPMRGMGEKLALRMLFLLMDRFDTQMWVVELGIVERWIVQQNWGDSVRERRHNFLNYIQVQGAKTNNTSANLILQVYATAEGKQALDRAKLPSDRPFVMDADETEDEVRPASGTPALRIRSAHDNGDGQRPRRTMQEVQMRHRHREAMVFNDGSRPVDSRDIIQRTHPSP